MYPSPPDSNWSRSKLKICGAAVGFFGLIAATPFLWPPIVNVFGPGVLVLYVILLAVLLYVWIAESIFRDRILIHVTEYHRSGCLGFIPTTEDAVKIYLAARKNQQGVCEYLHTMQELESASTNSLSRDFLFHGY